MTGAHIFIWHGTRLFGECLAHTLNGHEQHRCKWIDPCAGAGPNVAWLNEFCELLLLDAATPPSCLKGILQQVRQRRPECKSLLLVPEMLNDQLFGLTTLGSQGCIRENSSIDELCTAIRLVLHGKPYFSPELANALFAQVNGHDGTAGWGEFVDSNRLTSREQEVLKLIAWENLSNKQIARRLHVSLYTVKNHVHNIIEKLDVSDRHGAVQLAQRRNLIPSCSAV